MPEQSDRAGPLVQGAQDPRGLTVRRIYIATEQFTIYSSDDDEDPNDFCSLRYVLHAEFDRCQQLRKHLTQIESARSDIMDTICGMRPLASNGRALTRFSAFRERLYDLLARAMATAFERGDTVEGAKEAQAMIESARLAVEERRDSQNRVRYIKANALATVLVLTAGLLALWSGWLSDTQNFTPPNQLQSATQADVTSAMERLEKLANTLLGPQILNTKAADPQKHKILAIYVLMAGALGAFFSVAFSIKNLKVKHAITQREMFVAGSVRIPVGMIAAGVLLWLIQGGWILSSVDPDYLPASVLLFGFLAGFSEMFVPNALTRIGEQTEVKSPAKP